jgi:hypothetical protein
MGERRLPLQRLERERCEREAEEVTSGITEEDAGGRRSRRIPPR